VALKVGPSMVQETPGLGTTHQWPGTES